MLEYLYKSITKDKQMIKLSQTSKMPCKSWSIEPLANCNRGSKLATKENTICSACYACKGRYVFHREHRRDQYNYWKEDRIRWTTEMIVEIRKVTKRNPYFRWFDSGDLTSQEMLIDIVTIAYALPKVNFWLPTREIAILHRFFSKGLQVPENLNVRVSLDYVGETAKRYTDLRTKHNHTSNHWSRKVTFSTVGANEGHLCPATHDKDRYGSKCGDCRLCWDIHTESIDYAKH